MRRRKCSKVSRNKKMRTEEGERTMYTRGKNRKRRARTCSRTDGGR